MGLFIGGVILGIVIIVIIYGIWILEEKEINNDQ